MENRRRSTPDDAIQKETETESSGDCVPKEDNEVKFVSKTGHSDLTLKVDGHKIQVVKAVLCVASPVFAAMFEGQFEESRQREIELPGKTFHDFVEFLRCFYPDKLEPVTTENMYRILPYVIEYQVDVLEKRCHRLIVETLRKSHIDNESEIYRHIQLAELYSLEELKNKAIELASELSLEQMERGSTK